MELINTVSILVFKYDTSSSQRLFIIFVRDLVSSVDNLQRALESVPDDKSQLSEPIKNLIIGLEIVEKEILNTFEKHSLKQINPLGKIW